MDDLRPVQLAILEILSLKPRLSWYPIAIELPAFGVVPTTNLIVELRILEKEGLIARFESDVDSGRDKFELTPLGASIVQQQES